MDLEILGIKLKLVYVAGESSDQIFVWLPEKKVLLSGDNLYAIFPNIYTIRGVVYRDPMNYVSAIDMMIQLEPEYMVPSHVMPVIGKDKVMDILITTRDATQYVYDQTIRGMNNGYTADELSHMIKVPEHLADHPWTTQTRGLVPWYVKNIYYGNLGWFEGDPAFLNPISLEERSEKIISLAGGVNGAISEIYKAIQEGDYEWAAELATYAIHTDPDNVEAKLLKAHALRAIGQRITAVDGRHWYLTTALELEGKIKIDPNAFTQTSSEQLAALPIEKILNTLPTKLDPKKAEGVNKILGAYFNDVDEGYTLHVRNNILAVTKAFPEKADFSLTMNSDVYKSIVGGNQTVIDAIDADEIEFEGNVDELHEFIEMFDPLTVATEMLG